MISAVDLKADMLSEPYGIDPAEASFSWVINDTEDEMQNGLSDYRIFYFR